MPRCLLQRWGIFSQCLFNERSVAPTTFKGYRAMLSDMLKHWASIMWAHNDIFELFGQLFIGLPSRSCPLTILEFGGWGFDLFELGSLGALARVSFKLNVENLFFSGSSFCLIEIHALFSNLSCLQFDPQGLLQSIGFWLSGLRKLLFFLFRGRVPWTGLSCRIRSEL